MSFSYQQIAKNLNIAQSTAHLSYSRFEQTGNVDPSPNVVRPCQRKLNELFVVGLVLNNPTMYLEEICQEIHCTLQTDVSVSVICKLLRRYGITRKKIRQCATQRCYALRGAFLSQCSLLKPAMFVWVDETGTDRRDNIRKFGYSLRGMTPVSHRFLSRVKRINVIAAMSLTEGIFSTEITNTTVSGDTFYDFVRGSLIPNMLPFDGVNERSVVVMDNCSIHHIEPVTSLLNEAGIVTLFLPPYSPDLNPIEEVFSYVKCYLRKHDSILQHITDPSDVIRTALIVSLLSIVEVSLSMQVTCDYFCIIRVYYHHKCDILCHETAGWQDDKTTS